jgi:hypothetical protein
MFTFMEDAAEAIASANVQMRDRGRIGDRHREWVHGPGIGDASMRAAKDA